MSKEMVTAEQAPILAKSLGKKINSISILFNLPFVEKNGRTYGSMFVNHEYLPTPGHWYNIDRNLLLLRRVSRHEAFSYQWHERVFISDEVKNAIRMNLPLILQIDLFKCHNAGDGIIISANYGRNFTAHVALAHKKNEWSENVLHVVKDNAKLIITKPGGERHSINIPNGSTIHLE